MGRVWLGWDNQLARNVAIKVPHGGPNSPQAHLLRREALMAARLEHPGIITVHDVFETPEGPAFVMALVRGQSFSERLAEASADPETRSRLILPLADAAAAVGTAHARGIVHRDLSPKNILVGEDGKARVVDWGLAAELGSLVGTDAPSAGTPGYTSPEQQMGQTPRPTHDVWSLGAVLRAVLHGPALPDGASRLSRVSPELEAIVARAMHNDPHQRYPHAGEFAEDLRRWLEGRRVEAYAFPAWKLALRVIVQWKWPLAAGAVGLLATGVALLWGAASARREAEAARAAEGGARVAAELARAAEQDARTALAATLAEQAISAFGRDQLQPAVSGALEALALAESARARGLLALVGALPGPDIVERAHLPDCPKWFVTGRSDRMVCLEEAYIWAWDGADVAWEQPLRLFEVRMARDLVVGLREGDAFMAVSLDDGTLLTHDRQPTIFGDSTGAWRFSSDSAVPLEPEWPQPPCSHRVWASLPLSDGRYVFSCHPDKVVVVDPLLPDAPDFIESDEAKAFGEDADGHVWVAATSGRVARLGRASGGLHFGEPVAALLPLPGAHLMVAQALSGVAHIFDTRTHEIVMHLPAAQFPLRVRPDGSIDGIFGREWLRLRMPSSLPRPLAKLPAGLSSIDWAPGTGWVYTGDGSGYLWGVSITERAPLERWVVANGVVKSIAAHPVTKDVYTTGVFSRGIWRLRAQQRRSLEHWHEAGRGSGKRLALFASGEALLAGFGPGVAVVAADGASEREVLRHDFVHDIGMSPDHRWAVLVSDRIWVMEQGNEPTRLPSASRWFAGAIDNGGRLALVQQGRLALHGPDGQELVHAAHPAAPMDVVFDPSGEWVVTASKDGFLRLFRAHSLDLRAEIPSHTSRAAAVAFSQDGAWLASAGWDGAVRVASMRWATAPLSELDSELSWWMAR